MITPIEDKPDLSHVKMFVDELLDNVLYQGNVDSGYGPGVYALDGTSEQLEKVYALIHKYFEGI